MQRLLTMMTFALVLFTSAAQLYAQTGGVDPGTGGCTDSPENPTAVLALAGTSGASLAWLRLRWKKGKKKPSAEV